MTSNDVTPAAASATTISVTPSIVATTEDTTNEVTDLATAIATDQTIYEQPLARSSTFDYLYEFSETRKVLEEFFKCPVNEDKVLENGSDVDSIVNIILADSLNSTNIKNNFRTFIMSSRVRMTSISASGWPVVRSKNTHPK